MCKYDSVETGLGLVINLPAHEDAVRFKVALLCQSKKVFGPPPDVGVAYDASGLSNGIESGANEPYAELSGLDPSH